jgi:D-sedoheptulose 7-phosphate isomerase
VAANGFDFTSSIESRKGLLEWLEERGWPEVRRVAAELAESLRKGGAVFSCGNGGSASQAEHFAAELSGRFKLDRKSLPVFALSTNTASVTAISNDFGFAEMFARQIEGIGKTGDCLVALSTSGESKNIVRACETARHKGMMVISLTGRSGGSLAGVSDRVIRVPDTDTARIQEMHLLILHLACQMIEESLFAPRTAESPGT